MTEETPGFEEKPDVPADAAKTPDDAAQAESADTAGSAPAGMRTRT